MSAAEKFEMVDNEFNVEDCTVDRVYKAKDSSGKVVGVCTIIETKGYDSGLKSAVGVDSEGKVTGVEIISHKETPGLGANAEKEEFRSQYVGKPGKISVVKSNADKNEINAISGATMTSNGVTRSVNGALEIAKKIIGGEREYGKENGIKRIFKRLNKGKPYICTAVGNVSDACRYNKS